MSTAANSAHQRVDDAHRDPRAGLTNASGMRSTPTRAESGRAVSFCSIRSSRRRNLPLATRAHHRLWRSTAQCNHDHPHTSSRQRTQPSPPRTANGCACWSASARCTSWRRSRSTRSSPPNCRAARGSTPRPPASAELATGALLLAPRTRRLGALAAVALFVAVFPANVNMVRLCWDKGWPARIATLARLPLQVPMITQALKVYRNAPR